MWPHLLMGSRTHSADLHEGWTCEFTKATSCRSGVLRIRGVRVRISAESSVLWPSRTGAALALALAALPRSLGVRGGGVRAASQR
jgi:hypothetical protein